MKYFPSFLGIAIFCFINSFAFGFQTPKNMNNSFDYDKAWAEIDSLFKVYQYKNISEPLEKAYQQAKADKASGQIIKAITYKTALLSVSEENAQTKIKQLLDKELSEATFPNDAILHSMMGGYYYTYAQNNYWRIWENTAVNEADLGDDIAAWSMKALIDAAFKHYGKSVENKNTFAVPIEDYVVLLNKERESSFLRPTLYDILAHRALDFYTKDNNYLITPAAQFQIEQAEAFGSISDFINTDFKKIEELSGKHQAILLLQDLLRIHLQDKKPEALIDVNLRRLQFAYNYATISDKQNKYLEALETLKKTYAEQEAFSEIMAYIGDIYYEKGSNYNSYNTTNKWDWKQAFERYEEGITKFPDSYGAKLCQNKQAVLMQKSLSAGAESVIIPQKPSLIWLNFRNIPHVYLKVIPATEDLKKAQYTQSVNDFVAAMNKISPVLKTEFDLPDDGDYHEHTTEFKLDGLPLGEYFMLISNNEEFSHEYQAVHYTLLKSSNLAYFSKQRADGKTDFYAVDRTSGQPQKNVKVEFYTSDYNYTLNRYESNKFEESLTDKSGKATLKEPMNQYYYPKFIKGKDILDLPNMQYDYPPNEQSSQMATKFFLDRKIYRPGQVVFFKGIIINKSPQGIPSIVPNQKTKISFLDANGQIVEVKEMTSNEFGTFNGSFIAPANGLTGYMSITSDIGDYYYNGSSINFLVEEYKRPKFEMAFNPVDGSYSLNDEVTVSGFAKAYAGNNIDGAKVSYRVVRKTSHPYWKWWMWGIYPSVPDTEIINGETTTDENGVFKIQFKALPDESTPESQSPLFTFEIMADVTDITGETHSSSTFISAGYIALQANISVPEEVNRSELKAFRISTTNLNGSFEPATGSITITPLVTPTTIYKSRSWAFPDVHMLSKEDYARHFPGIAYTNEDEVIYWAKGEAVLTHNFNTAISKELSFENIDTKNWKPGYYELKLTTQDKNGKAIEMVKSFKVFDLASKEIAGNAPRWLHFNSKAYEPNSTAQLYYGTAYKSIFMLYEQYATDGRLETSKWVNIKNSKNIKPFPILIKESDRGGIGASFTFLMENRGYSDYQSIYVPWTNKDLKIEYQTFRNKLLPGQDEEWRIKISGNKKEKVAAEVAAAMYDASLDAFVENSWYLDLFPNRSPNHICDFSNNFSTVSGSLAAMDWQPVFPNVYRQYPFLDIDMVSNSPYYGYYERANQPLMARSSVVSSVDDSVLMEEVEEVAEYKDADGEAEKQKTVILDKKEESSSIATIPASAKQEDFSNVKVRTNLNETVFFYPELKTDENGDVIISFKMNEALTRWKLLIMAHTKDLEIGFSTNSTVTQKDLMVQPNPPRFFRENDVMELTAKVSNLSDRDLSGTAKIECSML
jgi:hypothetical protein